MQWDNRITGDTAKIERSRKGGNISVVLPVISLIELLNMNISVYDMTLEVSQHQKISIQLTDEVLICQWERIHMFLQPQDVYFAAETAKTTHTDRNKDGGYIIYPLTSKWLHS